MKTVIILTAGWLCILSGAVGFVLPVVPGIPLLIAGVILLSGHHAWARRLLARFRKRFPDVWMSVHNRKQRLKLWWNRFRERRQGVSPGSMRGDAPK